MRDLKFILKPKYSKSRALIIGINKYKNAPPLSYAVNDAQEVGNILINKFNFPKGNVTFLMGSKATKNNILRHFFKYSNDSIDIDERILIFFAGHGYTKTGYRGEVGYLVPYDANMEDFTTFIRWAELTQNSEIIRAKHMLFIMDACYGGLAITRNILPGSTRFLKDMYLRYSRQVLTAGKADEVVADSGGPIPNHSVFTGHLIEGLNGKAANEQGIISACGLMAYVYNKVANDKNSNQTPHYGHFDGDGDFIFIAPPLENTSEERQKDIDKLMVVPLIEEEHSSDNIKTKISNMKRLLSSESSIIELHDYLTRELRQFISESNADRFKVESVNFSDEEFLNRISKYESIVSDLSSMAACIAYWARPNHKQILQKILARSTDRLESKQGGLVIWNNLKWYPSIIQLYCSGIASVEGQRFDSLANIFFTRIGSSEPYNTNEYFIEYITSAMLELQRDNVFKKIPKHEKYFIPLSEYLYKLLQPILDDVLFIGKNYGNSFDEFEVMLALVAADLKYQKKKDVWGPVGRFGWKHSKGADSPFMRIIQSANIEKENWEPLKQGMFGGNYQRFTDIASEYNKQILSRLNWY